MTTRMIWTWVLLAVATSVAPVRAENGRDFVGQYAFSNPVETDGNVTVSLTVRLTNVSGADHAGLRLLLRVGTPEKPLSEDLSLANHANKVVDTRITLPAEEFRRIKEAGPVLAVEWHETDGSVARRGVENIRETAVEVR